MIFVCVCVLQIFYKVTREIFPGEELLLFMKAEEFPCDTMAPDIHGAHHTNTVLIATQILLHMECKFFPSLSPCRGEAVPL